MLQGMNVPQSPSYIDTATFSRTQWLWYPAYGLAIWVFRTPYQDKRRYSSRPSTFPQAAPFNQHARVDNTQQLAFDNSLTATLQTRRRTMHDLLGIHTANTSSTPFLEYGSRQTSLKPVDQSTAFFWAKSLASTFSIL